MEDKEQRIKIQFDTNADETKGKVDKVTDSLGKTSKETDKVTDSQKKAAQSSKGLGDSIDNLGGPIGGAISGFKAMVVQMWAIVANPIGAVIAAIVAVFAILYQTLKKFDPVMDALEQGFNAVVAVFDTLLDGVLSLITGAKSLGDVFGSLGSDISEAAKEAVEFTKIQQELNDLMIKSTVSQAKYNREINELILQSKDRTKTEAERIALIDKALLKEKFAYAERKNIADEELKVAQNNIISEANLSKAQQKALKEKGIDYAFQLQASKGFDEALIKDLASKLANQENLENESVSLREKALNRKYSLEDAASEKQKALEEKAEAARKKREEANKIARQKAADEEKTRFDKRQKELDDFAAKVEIDAYVKKEDDRKKKIADDDKNHAIGLDKLKARLAEDVQANQEATDEKIAIDKAAAKQKQQNKDDILATGEALIAGAMLLAGKNKKMQKAAIIAEAAVSLGKVGANIATGVSKDAATGAIASVPLIIKTIATGALATASIIGNTSKALKALGGGSAPSDAGGSTPRPGGGESSSATPQVSFQASRENQIATSVSKNNANQPPIQAFVVGKQVTTQQSLDNNKIKSNSI